MKQTLSELKNLTHQYSANAGSKKVRISNTLSQINVVGDDKDNKITEQLVEFNSGEHLQVIDQGCFRGCTKLKKVVLQPQTTTIRSEAFLGCTSLEDINIDNVIFNTIGSSAFYDTGLKRAQLKLFKAPDGSFGECMFGSCKSLKEVYLTANYVPAKMFSGCNSLTSIHLTLSAVDENTPFIDEDALSGISSLAELMIAGDFDDVPSLSGFEQLKSVMIESSSRPQFGDYVFSNTPRLSSIDLSKCVQSVSQFSLSAFAGSSLKQITVSALTKDDLKSSMLSYTKAEILAVEDLKKLIKEYEKTASGEENDPPFYYGRLYSDIPKLINYALNNKLPFMIINVPLPYVGNLENGVGLFSFIGCKLVHDWISQQKCLFGIQIMFERGEMPKITFNDIFDEYYIDEYETTFRNPFSSPHYAVKNTRYERPEYKNAEGLVWSSAYDGSFEIKYEYDGTTAIEYYRNGIQGDSPNNFTKRFNIINVPTTVYKFYNTNSMFLTHKITYDINEKTLKETQEITDERSKRTISLKTAPRLHLNPRYEEVRYCPMYSNEWSWDRFVNICMFVPYVVDYDMKKKTDEQYELSVAKTTYANSKSMNLFRNMERAANVMQKQMKESKFEKIETVFKNVNIVAVQNCTFSWFILRPNLTYFCHGIRDGITMKFPNQPLLKWFDRFTQTIEAEADGEIIDDNNVTSKTNEIQEKYAEYKKSGYYVNQQAAKQDDIMIYTNNGIKNTLRQIDKSLNTWLSEYERVDKYNGTYTPIEIDFEPDEVTNVETYCWNIGHDCTFTTSKNVKVIWNDKKKKFS